MKPRAGERRLPKGYTSPYGTFHSKVADTHEKVFGNMRVSMNSVSAGHVQISKTAPSLREERAYLQNLKND